MPPLTPAALARCWTIATASASCWTGRRFTGLQKGARYTERDDMTTTMDEQNAMLKAAVAERLANTPKDDHKMAGLAPVDEFLTRVSELSKCQDAPQENYSEWTPPAYARQTGDGVLGARPTVAEQTLQSALEAVRDRHGKYGPPNEHFGRTASLVNAAFGTTFSAADWALVMVLDKVARLRGPTPTTDGGVDIAGYGGCYEECRSTLP